MEQKKKLNTFDIFSLGFGGAVGSGIFVMMGLGIGHTGKSIVIALLGGCVIMLLAYMYNVVFSSMFVLSGGDYSQKAMVFSPLLTGVSGIFTVLNGFALAMYSVCRLCLSRHSALHKGNRHYNYHAVFCKHHQRIEVHCHHSEYYDHCTPVFHCTLHLRRNSQSKRGIFYRW